ncbi:MAG: large-conductance mechanosensitive channel protein MscL [Clostridia bacterium]|nr:large-conductance mechanosensitive channel protein MscL [Clostridia bacterium]
MKFFSEFKTFIARGNVMDMAVGVVVGGAFKSIIDSLVADIIMPAVSLLTGKINIADLAVRIPNPLDMDKVLISLNYGNFLQQIVNFLIIAFTIFVAVKCVNIMHDKMRRKAEVQVAEEPPAPTSEELLAEIRDILKNENSKNESSELQTGEPVGE